MRVGVVGYGNVGQYLVQQIEEHASLELAFVWNRTVSALDDLQNREAVLENLSDFASRKADLIVEVAHPNITKQWGARFLATADYMIGSPTALSDATLETELRNASSCHGLYIPTGAFWGGDDIKKMADRGTLQALKVTMKKHPSSFKLNGDLKITNEQVLDNAVVLYQGVNNSPRPIYRLITLSHHSEVVYEGYVLWLLIMSTPWLPPQQQHTIWGLTKSLGAWCQIQVLQTGT
ncbi:aspartate dehydrogenase domain-containing protein-like isoform X2 [Ylistrum balloti]|uniref:aspartate dehydrogenase domain-containing protein-like isoform X2 n=1 Tax=Ylistrum balloti TaxID=509963 RepID=UPI00290587E2|nr:aspartate dehydrogenase domain-containing protein-like isoform X2 [Ylistrum balloti]